MSSYKTYKLTDPECKSCKPKAKLYKLRDGGALSLNLMPSKVWRYAYRLQGKQKIFTIGKYPEISLSEARTSRDGSKKLVSSGIDPLQQKQIIKPQISENSFQGIAETCLAQIKSDLSDTHYTRLKNHLPRNPAKDINLTMLLPKIIKRHFSAISIKSVSIPVGSSGQTIIAIIPELKQNVYKQFNQKNINLKQWFLYNTELFLNNKNQLDLCFNEGLKGSHNNTITEVK